MPSKKRRRRQTSRHATYVAPTHSRVSSADFNPDYTHVRTDLRRIGTLAAIFFVLLIVLRFLLPFLPIG
jgi:hypothetical protein